MFQFIDTQDTLNTFCQAIQSEGPDFITVDTEFLRESTYWPKLCLIQVASPEHVAAIDPLCELDLGPFFALLHDPKITKVFHAAYQDLEIFYHLTQTTPTPLFDTQVAGMVCGYGEAISYEALVNSLAHESIDKGSRFTDWSNRPLTQKQLDYALGDVTHLRVIYQKLKEKIEKTDRGEWITEEMEILSNPRTYAVDPYEMWRRVRFRNMKPKGLAILREIAALREIEAQNKDVPRNRILKDESMLEIAASAPQTLRDLKRIRGISDKQAEGRIGKTILDAVKKGLSLPAEDYPPAPEKRGGVSSGQVATIEMLKTLLRIKCDEHHVAAKLVASSKDIEDLAKGVKSDIPALHGWRYKIFGKDAMDMKNGQLALTLKDRKIKLIRV